MTTPSLATARLSTIRLRHPVRNEAAHIIDLDAWADAARLVARQGRRVDIVHHVASSVPTPPDDIAAHVARVADGFRGEARRAHGAAWRWTGASIAGFLAVAWFDAVTGLISALTSTGGAAVAPAIALIPTVFGARKVIGHARRARALGAIGRALATARIRRATVVETGGEAVHTFANECLASLTELDSIVARLADAPIDACARGAVLALGISRAAARHGLAPVSDAYHAVYVALAGADIQATRTEQAGGMLADSRVRSILKQAHTAVHNALAPFRVFGAVRTSPMAPLVGVMTGLAMVAGATGVGGTFVVPTDTAVIIDPPGARLARLASGFGIDLNQFGLDGDTRVIVRAPELQWSWPAPFADRRAVVLGDQYATVRSVVIRTGPDNYTVLQVRMRFRIIDLGRWVRFDADGKGAGRLGRGLSSELQSRLELVARDLLQRGSRDPQYAQNPRALARQVEQVMVMQLPAVLGQFAGVVNTFDIVAEAGVRIDAQIRQTDVGLDRSATAATAGLSTGP
jgi:hypothetical protein